MDVVTPTVRIEEVDEVSRVINIEIPRPAYNREFGKAVSRAANQSQAKGFRPGKVPPSMVQKVHGAQIHSDILGNFVQNAVKDAMKDHKLQIVGKPSIEVTSSPLDEATDKDICIRAFVSLFPQVVVKNYFGLNFEVEIGEVSPKDIEEVMARLCEHHGSNIVIDDRQVIEDGDIVTATYNVTYPNGKQTEEEGQEVVQMKRGATKDAVYEGLLGARIGEKKTIEIEMDKFDSQDNTETKDLPPLSLQCHFTPTKIERRIPAELTDDFAKTTKLADNVAGLKEAISKRLEAQVEEQNMMRVELKLFDVIAEQAPFKIPQVMVDNEIRLLLFEQGIVDPSDRNSHTMDVKYFRKSYQDRAYMRMRNALILNEILKAENYSIDDQEFDSWIENKAKEASCSTEELQKRFGLPANLEHIKKEATKDLMIDKMLNSSVITKVIKNDEENKMGAS